MQSIRKSECPKELEPADRRSSVHVNLIRRNENCPVCPFFQQSSFSCCSYLMLTLFDPLLFASFLHYILHILQEPETRHVPFQGVGRTLGGGSTDVPEQTVSASAPTSAPSPSPGLSVDTSLPSTSIQLRLADGTRMVARFNFHHTVGDIRAFIDASRSGGTRAYQLQTVGFPPKQLTDMTQTIEQAGLGNSVVIQKF